MVILRRRSSALFSGAGRIAAESGGVWPVSGGCVLFKNNSFISDVFKFQLRGSCIEFVITINIAKSQSIVIRREI